MERSDSNFRILYLSVKQEDLPKTQELLGRMFGRILELELPENFIYTNGILNLIRDKINTEKPEEKNIVILITNFTKMAAKINSGIIDWDDTNQCYTHIYAQNTCEVRLHNGETIADRTIPNHKVLVCNIVDDSIGAEMQETITLQTYRSDFSRVVEIE